MSEFVEQPIYAELARVAKAMSNPVRLRLLDLLDAGELPVEELAGLAGLPVKNTSAQLQQLRSAQLVAARRDGTRVFYRIANPAVSRFLGTYHDFAQSALSELRAEIERHLGPDDQLRPVGPDELSDLIATGEVVVVDVRPAADYAREHVPGALSVPADEVSRRLDELPDDQQIVAYCQGPYCVASPHAVRRLTAAGRQARILSGGWTAWSRSGHEREPA